MKAGDIVFHRPTGEEWMVKRITGDHLEWMGWPPGRARVSDCDLLKECTPIEHEAVVSATRKEAPDDR